MCIRDRNNEGNLLIDSIHIGMDGITTVLEKIGGMPEEILGCTDSTADNYNPEATEEDGTCAFIFQPKDRDELNAAVNFWFNDSDLANSTFGEIGTWNVTSITDMSWVFANTTSLNPNISGWDVSSVTNMRGMFAFADNFNGDVSGWDVSNVTDMALMFYEATTFNSDISSWNVSSVTDMEAMFAYAVSFNSDISDWDVSSVTNMGELFSSATSFNSDISDWDVSNVTRMSLSLIHI